MAAQADRILTVGVGFCGKREIKTNISANSAELIVLGGLIENKNTASTAGLSFLPAFLSAKSNSNDKTEIILSLYVEILPEK